MSDGAYMGTALMRDEEENPYTLISTIGAPESEYTSFGAQVQDEYDVEEIVRCEAEEGGKEMSSVTYVVEGNVADEALGELDVETGARKRHSDKPPTEDLEKMAARVITTGMLRMLDIDVEGVKKHEYESTNYSEEHTPEVQAARAINAAGGNAVPAEDYFLGIKEDDEIWRLTGAEEVIGQVFLEDEVKEVENKEDLANLVEGINKGKYEKALVSLDI